MRTEIKFTMIVANWIKENDKSEPSEPYVFIHKEDLENWLGLPKYFFSKKGD